LIKNIFKLFNLNYKLQLYVGVVIWSISDTTIYEELYRAGILVKCLSLVFSIYSRDLSRLKSLILNEGYICPKEHENSVIFFCLVRARLAQLQLLILSEDLEEPCQTGIFFKLILVWSRKIRSRFL
jgi:hypothetical protein